MVMMAALTTNSERDTKRGGRASGENIRGHGTLRVGKKHRRVGNRLLGCEMSYLRLGIDFPFVSWLPSDSSVSGSSTVADFCAGSTFGGAVVFRPGLDELLLFVSRHISMSLVLTFVV